MIAKLILVGFWIAVGAIAWKKYQERLELRRYGKRRRKIFVINRSPEETAKEVNDRYEERKALLEAAGNRMHMVAGISAEDREKLKVTCERLIWKYMRPHETWQMYRKRVVFSYISAAKQADMVLSQLDERFYIEEHLSAPDSDFEEDEIIEEWIEDFPEIAELLNRQATEVRQGITIEL